MKILTLTYNEIDACWIMTCLNKEGETEAIEITDSVAKQLITHGGFEQLKFKEWKDSHLYIYEIPY